MNAKDVASGPDIIRTDGTKSRTINILNVFPDIYTEELAQVREERVRIAESLEERTGDLVKMDTVFPEKGGASLEDHYDEVVNGPYILEEIRSAREGAYDAIVIDCFSDPVLDAARQIADVPVLGANQSACFLAAQLGRKFGIIGILPEMNLTMDELATKYRLNDYLAAVKIIDIAVLDLEKDVAQTAKKIADAALTMAREDGAHAAVLGCTGLGVALDRAQEILEDEDVEIPLIEPLQAAIHNAVYWVQMDVMQSGMIYLPPRDKKRIHDFDV